MRVSCRGELVDSVISSIDQCARTPRPKHTRYLRGSREHADPDSTGLWPRWVTQWPQNIEHRRNADIFAGRHGMFEAWVEFGSEDKGDPYLVEDTCDIGGF